MNEEQQKSYNELSEFVNDSLKRQKDRGPKKELTREEKKEKAEQKRSQDSKEAREKYMARVKERHKNLPEVLLREMGNTGTKGAAQRFLKAYLQTHRSIPMSPLDKDLALKYPISNAPRA